MKVLVLVRNARKHSLLHATLVSGVKSVGKMEIAARQHPRLLSDIHGWPFTERANMKAFAISTLFSICLVAFLGCSATSPLAPKLSQSLPSRPPVHNFAQRPVTLTHTPEATLTQSDNPNWSFRASPAHSPTPLLTLGPRDDLRQIVASSNGVVLVDFYADWCGPCRKQGNILHDMERAANQNQASIVKINVDQHQELAKQFQVESLPTLVVFKNGQIIDRQTGLADHEQVASLLSK